MNHEAKQNKNGLDIVRATMHFNIKSRPITS